MQMETQTTAKKNISKGILKTIYTRRAVRRYTEQAVERDLIGQVIDAGRMAPSAINNQPWKFYVLTDPVTIKSFSKEIIRAAAKVFMKSGVKTILKTIKDSLHFGHALRFTKENDPIFHGAPVVIFITAPKNYEWAGLDIGMCAQNMMLAAKEMGLDTCPVGLAKFVEQTKLFPQLQIPASEQVMLAVILGYGNEEPEIHKRKKDNVLYIDLLTAGE